MKNATEVNSFKYKFYSLLFAIYIYTTYVYDKRIVMNL